MTIKIELSSDIVSTDNFLHNRDQIKVTITQEIENVSVKVLQTRVQEKKDQIYKQHSQIDHLKEEIRDKKDQIEGKNSRIEELLILINTIEEMKKKSNNVEL